MTENKPPLPPEYVASELERRFYPRHRIILVLGGKVAIEYAWGEEFTEEDWEWAETISKQFEKKEK